MAGLVWDAGYALSMEREHNMKRLILHIGTHKTATTAIQNTLHAKRDSLIEDSVYYAKTDRPPFENLHKHTSIYSALIQGPEAWETEMGVLRQEFEQSGCDTLVLSEEAFSEPRFDAYSQLGEFCKEFETTVVCYLRRPDLFLESLWNQHCKEGHQTENIGVYSRIPFNAERVSYSKVLDFWSDFATVKVANFDDAKNNGVVKLFSEITGLTLGEEAPDYNVSPSMNCAIVLAALNKAKKPFNKQKVIRAFKNDKQKYALGADLRREILDNLSDDLKVLKEKYNIEFDMTMPEEQKVPLVRPTGVSLASAFSHLCHD